MKPDKLFNIKFINDMGKMLTSSTKLNLAREQDNWHLEYYYDKVYHDLWEKLEPLGRVNEFVEATVNFEKRSALVQELLGYSL